MSPNQVSKPTPSSQQQIQNSSQHARALKTHEHHASANASAGLNLNIFGALSGAFSSKSKKTTHTNADGGSLSQEEKLDQGKILIPISSLHSSLVMLFSAPAARFGSCCSFHSLTNAHRHGQRRGARAGKRVCGCGRRGAEFEGEGE